MRIDMLPVFTVTELNEYVRASLDADPLLRNMRLRGEVVGFKRHVSGTLYFMLKDAGASISCVLFSRYVPSLAFMPADGMQVELMGNTALFVRDGRYQFYATGVMSAGQGALAAALERLKQKLDAEGLFDPAKKRPLPVLPRRIGVVTSSTGAAFRDIVHVARRRYPNVDIVLAPSAVQGAQAPAQLIAALGRVSRYPGVDIVIIGRGGGAAEELWAFNDESLARAIATCPVPVISAVGHEIDFTIADFVADLRAPTPSAAAEIATPDKLALLDRHRQYIRRMRQLCSRRVDDAGQRVLASRWALTRTAPGEMIAQRARRVGECRAALAARIDRLIGEKSSRLMNGAKRLESVSPLAVLARGYAIATGEEDGRVLSSAGNFAPGMRFILRLKDGSVRAAVSGDEEER